MKDAMKDLQHGSLEREEYIEKRKQITVAIKRVCVPRSISFFT
jgi:hypothetical protein